MNAMSHSGVWRHSTPTAYDTYIVFCVGNDKVREAAFKSWARNNEIGFKELVGSYKGTTETSFLVNEKYWSLCYNWFKNEETVLLLGPMERIYYGKNKGMYSTQRRARLWYTGTIRSQELGHFHETMKGIAMMRDCWSFDPSTGKYWITTDHKAKALAA